MNELVILLVEDNRRDAELITEALKEGCGPHRLILAKDGDEALRFIKNQPTLVLLDLNIPKVHGIDVLKHIRRDPSTRMIPTIIFTNSKSEEDVFACYSNFCNAYIRKPLGFDEITDVLQATNLFWFQTATLPKPPPPQTGPTIRPPVPES